MGHPKLNESEMIGLFWEKSFTKVIDFVSLYGIDAVDRDGRSLLINFIIEKRSDFAIELINKYIDNGLLINQQDHLGWTALHFAVQTNNLQLVEKLLESGAIVDLTEQNGNSPLLCGLFDKVDEEINIVLLKYGANINLENKHQIAPREFLEVNMTKVQKWFSENKK